MTSEPTSPLVVTVVITKGTVRGDFLPATAAGWTRSVSGKDIVYTRTFTGASPSVVAHFAVRSLAFKPRAGAATGEKTTFHLSVNDGLGAISNPFEISALTF